MSETGKKQTFLHGAAWLLMSNAIVKIIGALYKLPLNTVIGPEGFAYFSTAYQIYTVLMTLSVAGLPVAVSRLVSQKYTLGQFNSLRKLQRTATVIYGVLGGLFTLFMGAGCVFLANLLNQPDAWTPILCLSPSILLICVGSAYRGFFNGMEDMRPSSVAQVLEAAVKLLLGLGLAYVIMTCTGSIAYAAAGAILGVTVSCLVSLIYMRVKFGPAFKALPQSREQAQSSFSTLKSLLAISIPLIVSSSGTNLLMVVESGLYMDRLVYLVDTNQYMGELVTGAVTAQKAAASLKGVYDLTQTLFNLPIALISPLTVSLLPAISAAMAKDDRQEAKSASQAAVRVTGLICLPCALGLTVLARPIVALLGGGYDARQTELGAQLLAVQGIMVALYCFVSISNTVLVSYGKLYMPVLNMVICGVLRLPAVYILVSNPNLGILGAPLGALIGYAGSALLNLLVCIFCLPDKISMAGSFLRALLPAGLMAVAAWGAYRGLSLALGQAGSRLLLCALPIAAGVAVYCLALVVLRTVKREDCLLLPKGEKIARLFGYK